MADFWELSQRKRVVTRQEELRLSGPAQSPRGDRHRVFSQDCPETGERMSRLSPKHTHLSSIMSHWRLQRWLQAAASAPSMIPGQLSQLNPNKQGSGYNPGAWGTDPENQLEFLSCTDETPQGRGPGSSTWSRVKSNRQEQAGCPRCFGFCFPSVLKIKRLASHRSHYCP